MADLQGVTVVETNLRQASEMDVRSATNYIGIHHTGHCVNGVDTDIDFSASEINEMHINQGWSMIGYHFVIRKNGSIERGRPEDKIPAGVESHNSEHIHIHVCGTFTVAEPTSEQIDSLTKLLSALCTKYNITPSRTAIKGHKEFSGHESNDCPGTNLFNKLDSIVENIKSGNVGTGGTPNGTNGTKVPNKMTAEDLVNKIYGPTAAPVAFGSSEKQIPASVMIAMALRYGGLDTAEFKAWNVFGIKYIENISSGKKVDPDLCSFSTCSDAFTKLVTYIKTTTQFEKGIDKLAPKLEDSTEKQKEEFMDEICPEFAKINNLEKPDEYLADIKKLIADNKLYDWERNSYIKYLQLFDLIHKYITETENPSY